MNEKFNKNVKVEKLTKKVGRGVRLIVIGPWTDFVTTVDVWNAKLTETQIITELSIEIVSSLFN